MAYNYLTFYYITPHYLHNMQVVSTVCKTTPSRWIIGMIGRTVL